MVFKRRDRRSAWQVARQLVWPRGGWRRAFRYVTHRIRRLPDTPDRIARGIWVGVFAAFTPFYGVHFLIAALLALATRGNVVASTIGSLFNNPLTVVPIGAICLETGHFLLGRSFDAGGHAAASFGAAAGAMRANLVALFTAQEAQWDGLALFWREVFFPYLVGGLLPGIVVATVCAYLTIPLVSACRHRRGGRLARKPADMRDGER